MVNPISGVSQVVSQVEVAVATDLLKVTSALFNQDLTLDLKYGFAGLSTATVDNILYPVISQTPATLATPAATLLAEDPDLIQLLIRLNATFALCIAQKEESIAKYGFFNFSEPPLNSSIDANGNIIPGGPVDKLVKALQEFNAHS